MKPSLARYMSPLGGGGNTKRGMQRYVRTILLALVGIAFFGLIVTANDYKTMPIAAVGDHVKQACEPCYKIARNVYRELIVQNRMLSWHFYALVAIILLLEWTQPV